MAVFALTGLIPIWFVEERSVNTSSNSISYFVKEKGLAKGKPAAQHFLDSLTTVL
jgi:hypothetical protein